MIQYTIEISVNEQWLKDWDRTNIESAQEILENWIAIQCAGTGISVENVYKTEQDI